MSYYVDTEKSLVVFGLKHGSSGMQVILSEILDIDFWKARDKFEQIDIEALGREGYLRQHKKWFNEKIFKNKKLPIFLFIRDPEKAAFSSWIEDLNYWLHHNSYKALIEIPELAKLLKEKKIDHYHDLAPNFPFSMKTDHLEINDKELKSLILALDKKIYPFFYGHLLSHPDQV